MLRNEMVHQGSYLFRWRSYLPLALVPIGMAALQYAGLLERWLGEVGEELWVFACFLLALTGQTIRLHVVGHAPPGTSGRNTRAQRADVLNTTGLYSVCRHPLYLANFIVVVGILLAVQLWWFVLIGVLAFWIYYERIIAAEEAFLVDRFGSAYEEWAAVTPAFLPTFRHWRKPVGAFSWRRVLRREYYGYFAVISAFFVIEVLADLWVEGDKLTDWFRHDFIWPVLFAIGGTAFLTLRALKKHTRLLTPGGR